MTIEKGKYYLKIVDGYVIDALSYNPEKNDFILYENKTLPLDILNRCYQLNNGKLTRDEIKYAEFVEQQNKDAIIAKLQEKILQL